MRILFIFLLTSGTIIGQLPTAVSSPMFEDDFGLVSGDESMTWQLHENGTGLEIISGDDYYDSWFDTTELLWSANDDSMTLVFSYWDDYYYEEVSDTVDLAYGVENDTLSINATMDLCEKRDSLISVQKPAHRHCK